MHTWLRERGIHIVKGRRPPGRRPLRIARLDGTGQLTVGDLRAGLSWPGNPAHLRSVAAALDRAAQDLEDYLVVRAPRHETMITILQKRL
jgi:hypothetical protein